MCAEFVDKDGNTVEAFTPEEMEEKLNATKEEIRQEMQEEINLTEREMNQKEIELRQAQEDLETEKQKDKNLAGQRRVIGEKEKEIETMKADIGQIKKDFETKLFERDQKDKQKMIDGMVSELAGSDQNLKDKIKFYYDTFRPIDEKNKDGKEKTQEEIGNEIKERIKNAYTLASGGKSASPLSPAVISSAGATPVINPMGDKIKPEQQELAHKLGIGEGELKKHKLI